MSELKPFFSVIMAARVTPYKYQAKDIQAKMFRAIKSVAQQTCEDWELVIVSDNCDMAVELASEYVTKLGISKRTQLWRTVTGMGLWGGAPRNTGLSYARGEWAVYLDIDDMYGSFYLRDLKEEIEQHPEASYFVVDDLQLIRGNFQQVTADIDRKGKCGTSNVIHRLPALCYWEVRGKYDHDYRFIQRLKTTGTGARLNSCGYFVCHIPNKYDV